MSCFAGRRRGRCVWQGSSKCCQRAGWLGVAGFRLRSRPIYPLLQIRRVRSWDIDLDMNLEGETNRLPLLSEREGELELVNRLPAAVDPLRAVCDSRSWGTRYGVYRAAQTS